MTKLKPCPFCGYQEQSAELLNMPFKGHGWAEVRCLSAVAKPDGEQLRMDQRGGRG